MGCPIRKSLDQRLFAPTQGLSQLITSFIASVSQGIRHAPFLTFFAFPAEKRGDEAHTFSCLSDSFRGKEPPENAGLRRETGSALQSCLCQYVKDRVETAGRGRGAEPCSRSRPAPLAETEDSNLMHAGLVPGLLEKEKTETEQHRKGNEPETLPSPETERRPLQKGGVPAAPSGTATLLRLSPNHQFCPRPILAVTDFRHPRLSWLDGRCVQGPGTYSPRHG